MQATVSAHATNAAELDWAVMDDEQRAEFVRRHANTKSFKQIGEMVGVTRHVISGFCRPRGITLAKRAPQTLVEKVHPWRATPGNVRAGKGAALKPETIDHPHSVRLIDRKPNQCAWPLWDDDTPIAARMVCGCTVTDRADGKRSPYCAHHHARAFRVVAPDPEIEKMIRELERVAKRNDRGAH